MRCSSSLQRKKVDSCGFALRLTEIMLVEQKMTPQSTAVHLWAVYSFSAGLYCLRWLVKCRACFAVFQMKQHPEALNYSWDGSQQTLNSTWGNPAVTLQLILLLNPAAECVCEYVCVCVCVFLCFLYLSETCSDEALTHTHSHTDSFKPTKSMCQENNKLPLQLLA